MSQSKGLFKAWHLSSEGYESSIMFNAVGIEEAIQYAKELAKKI